MKTKILAILPLLSLLAILLATPSGIYASNNPATQAIPERQNTFTMELNTEDINTSAVTQGSRYVVIDPIAGRSIIYTIGTRGSSTNTNNSFRTLYRAGWHRYTIIQINQATGFAQVMPFNVYIRFCEYGYLQQALVSTETESFVQATVLPDRIAITIRERRERQEYFNISLLAVDTITGNFTSSAQFRIQDPVTGNNRDFLNLYGQRQVVSGFRTPAEASTIVYTIQQIRRAYGYNWLPIRAFEIEVTFDGLGNIVAAVILGDARNFAERNFSAGNLTINTLHTAIVDQQDSDVC